MSGELPKEFMSMARRREVSLKSQLARKMKLTLEEQIAMGLVEPIDPEKMVRRVGRKSRPGFP